MKFGTGSNIELTQNYARVKHISKYRTSDDFEKVNINDIRTSTHKLVVCLSTDGERA